MKYKIFFILILLITVLTRFVRLDFTPPHLSNDEISIAYDAYSVSKTLRDEHNHFLPLSFQSHNTYKAPLAIYLSVPTIKLFGNNEYGARLPSAILGSLTVLVLGLLVFELTQNLNLSFLSSFILSITPWHIYTSRMILESNLALFFVVLAIYFFFKGFHQDKKVFVILSFISFAVSIYGYHTEWGFTPLVLTTLLFLNYKKIIKKPVYYFGLILFFVLITPIFLDFLHNLGTHARANTEILFKDPVIEQQINNPQYNFFQKVKIISQSILGSYSSYLNLNYLFFDGLSLFPNNPYQAGLFLAPFLPCFLIGLFNVKKYFKDNTKFFYLWLIISPLIPVLTQGGPNFVRNLVSIVPYSIVIAIGLLIIVNLFRNDKLILSSIFVIISISFFYFWIIYFYQFHKYSGENFQYGYKQIAQYIQNNSSKFEKIIVDPRFGDYNLYDGVPYLYISYFTNLDPNLMLKRQETSGLYYSKYEIRSINWNIEKIKTNYLYVVPESNLPDVKNFKNYLQIRLPNDKPAFRIFSNI